MWAAVFGTPVQLVEQSLLLGLVLWVLGLVGSQGGPEVTLLGTSGMRLRPKVALIFCHF